MTGYVWALEEYPPDVLIQAARQVAKQHAWYPKPAKCGKLRISYTANGVQRDNREVRDQAYHLFDLYREGEITEEQFTSERAAQWVHKQHGIFSALFDKSH